MTRLKTDGINGPHVILEEPIANYRVPASLMIRSFYAGPGQVMLLLKRGRSVSSIIVDAADLIEAVQKLVPAAGSEEF